MCAISSIIESEMSVIVMEFHLFRGTRELKRVPSLTLTSPVNRGVVNPVTDSQGNERVGYVL